MRKLYVIGAHRVGKTFLCESIEGADPSVKFVRTELKPVFKPTWDAAKGLLLAGDYARFYGAVVGLQKALAAKVTQSVESIHPSTEKAILDRSIVDVLAYSTGYVEMCSNLVGENKLSFDAIEEFYSVIWSEIVPLVDKSAKYLLVQPGIPFVHSDGSLDEGTQLKTSSAMIKWAERLIPSENLVIMPAQTTTLTERMAYATKLLN